MNPKGKAYESRRWRGRGFNRNGDVNSAKRMDYLNRSFARHSKTFAVLSQFRRRVCTDARKLLSVVVWDPEKIEAMDTVSEV